ncbi:MAG TPA: hypothetical protein VE991_00055 [Acidimicrobiales bacterium]|nr:hypothetical protein [Acidimicrobiales bacterium]
MERDTVKHDARLDEELKHETRPLVAGAPVEGHTRDERLQEAGTDDEPVMDPSSRPGPTSEGELTREEASIRERLAQELRNAPFPTDRSGLMQAIGQADGRGDFAARLRMLPGDRQFADVHQVLTALAGMATERPA